MSGLPGDRVVVEPTHPRKISPWHWNPHMMGDDCYIVPQGQQHLANVVLQKTIRDEVSCDSRGHPDPGIHVGKFKDGRIEGHHTLGR
jgi:hypothetical protein